MRHRFLASLGALAAVIAVVWLASAPVAGQAPTAAAKTTAKTWTPPHTPWGDPDLQGVYTNKNDNNTPFERPKEFGERQLLTDAELAKKIEMVRKLSLDDPAERGDSALGDKLRAPLFWHERGTPSRLTSLVVDPPDGRIPPLTPEALKRGAGTPQFGGEGDSLGGAADSWLDRSLWERCVTRGLPSSMLPGLYGNDYQILQAPGYVAIRYEMVHDTRIIPLDRRPHAGPAIRSYMGDSRGHWEGNTLVVDVTNFVDKPNYETNFGRSGANLHLVERFTPVAPYIVNWEVTVEDPTTWTRPWTFRVPMTSKDDEDLQAGVQAPSKREVEQYECHEGNLGLINLLSSARNLDKQNAAKKKDGSR